jgi:hypothetical protein
MDYSKTIPFPEQKLVIPTVTKAFADRGFQISDMTETTAELKGPGMINSQQDPIVGISKASISYRGEMLTVEAEFGAIRKLLTYMSVFIVAMALFFLVLFGIIFTKQGKSPGTIVLISLAPLLPWPVLLPAMYAWMNKRTAKALDVLLGNMEYLSNQDALSS